MAIDEMDRRTKSEQTKKKKKEKKKESRLALVKDYRIGQIRKMCGQKANKRERERELG